MKIALTVWGDWISPVLDSAQTMLIVDIEGGKIQSRHEIPIVTENTLELLNLLKKIEVEQFICGAITENSAGLFESGSIDLVPFVTGKVDRILNVLVNNRAITQAHLMPGCKRRGRLSGPRCCQRETGRRRN